MMQVCTVYLPGGVSLSTSVGKRKKVAVAPGVPAILFFEGLEFICLNIFMKKQEDNGRKRLTMYKRRLRRKGMDLVGTLFCNTQTD